MDLYRSAQYPDGDKIYTTLDHATCTWTSYTDNECHCVHRWNFSHDQCQPHSEWWWCPYMYMFTCKVLRLVDKHATFLVELLKTIQDKNGGITLVQLARGCEMCKNAIMYNIRRLNTSWASSNWNRVRTILSLLNNKLWFYGDEITPMCWKRIPDNITVHQNNPLLYHQFSFDLVFPSWSVLLFSHLLQERLCVPASTQNTLSSRRIRWDSQTACQFAGWSSDKHCSPCEELESLEAVQPLVILEQSPTPQRPIV